MCYVQFSDRKCLKNITLAIELLCHNSPKEIKICKPRRTKTKTPALLACIIIPVALGVPLKIKCSCQLSKNRATRSGLKKASSILNHNWGILGNVIHMFGRETRLSWAALNLLTIRMVLLLEKLSILKELRQHAGVKVTLFVHGFPNTKFLVHVQNLL